ncbi:MAG: glutamate--tRNA ligase [Acetobacteraceae bacterium]|nr:glutamate--tRNA ligase [Acetobacteraceae bacterium]
MAVPGRKVSPGPLAGRGPVGGWRLSGVGAPAGKGGAAAPVRVRFAPSPTGSLHVGGARTALFNWLFARRHGGAFVLRIEDTDVERSREEASGWITAALSWLGLDWDEGPGRAGPYGPYFQSQRIELYRRAAQDLLERGLAYPCFCTPEELAERRDEARRMGLALRYDGRCRGLGPGERRRLEAEGRPHAVRLRVPQTGSTVVDDLIRGRVGFDHSTLDDFVLLKSDGMPTYNFACVVDDLAMRISHVIRAEEHLSNTPKQLLLYEALGQSPPLFAHVPMILAPDRSKLSKRHGATSVEEFREQGFLPQALVNYLALLGWSPPEAEEGRELFTLAELAERFSLDRVVRTAAVYDVGKLTWFNSHYLRQLDPARALELALPFFVREGLVPPDPPPEVRQRVAQAVELLRPRVRTLAEMARAGAFFFRPVTEYDREGWEKWLERPGAVELLEKARERVRSLEVFDPPAIEAAYRRLAADLGIPTPPLFHATRVAVTGSTVGPGLFDTMSLLGQRAVEERLAKAVQRLKEASGGGG